MNVFVICSVVVTTVFDEPVPRVYVTVGVSTVMKTPELDTTLVVAPAEGVVKNAAAPVVVVADGAAEEVDDVDEVVLGETVALDEVSTEEELVLLEDVVML